MFSAIRQCVTLDGRHHISLWTNSSTQITACSVDKTQSKPLAEKKRLSELSHSRPHSELPNLMMESLSCDSSLYEEEIAADIVGVILGHSLAAGQNHLADPLLLGVPASHPSIRDATFHPFWDPNHWRSNKPFPERVFASFFFITRPLLIILP
jgi:hypothetical protein